MGTLSREAGLVTELQHGTEVLNNLDADRGFSYYVSCIVATVWSCSMVIYIYIYIYIFKVF
jgi:hypothetical protein